MTQNSGCDSTLRGRIAALETELRDLAFMEKQGYIAEGPRGNSATKGQLQATIRNAQEALEDIKNAVKGMISTRCF